MNDALDKARRCMDDVDTIAPMSKAESKSRAELFTMLSIAESLSRLAGHLVGDLRTKVDEHEIDHICQEIREMGWTPDIEGSRDDFANCYWATAHVYGAMRDPNGMYRREESVGVSEVTRLETAQSLRAAIKERVNKRCTTQ